MENKELKDKLKFRIAMSELDDEVKKEKTRLKSGLINKVAVVACFAMLVGSITYAEEISEKVYDMYSFKENDVIEINLSDEIINDEEKLEEVLSNRNSIIKWDENTAEVIESSDVKVDITEVYMGNYYMQFNANINFTKEVFEKMPLSEINTVRFIDLVIKDENDNVLFCIEENKLKEVFNSNDLNFIKNNPKYLISEITSMYTDRYNIPNGVDHRLEYSLNTRQPSIYPKSKKLTIEFTKMALDKKEASIGIDKKHRLHQDQSLTIIGDWKIEIDVPAKYYNREDVIAYKVVKNDSNLKNQVLFCYYKDGVMNAEVNLASEERMHGPWGTVKLGDMLNEYNVDPIIKEYISYKFSASDEYKNLENWQREVYRLEDYWIENEKGEKSKPSGLYKVEGDSIVYAFKTGGLGGGVVVDNILKSSSIPGIDPNGNWREPPNGRLDIEKDKLTDKMTLHIKYLGKDIKFELEKMKGDK